MIVLVGYMKTLTKHPKIIKSGEKCSSLIEKYEKTKQYHNKMKLFTNFIQHYQLRRFRNHLKSGKLN